MRANISAIKKRCSMMNRMKTLNSTPDDIMKVIGTPSGLENLADGTVSGALKDIYDRLGSFSFITDNKTLTVMKKTVEIAMSVVNMLSNNTFDITKIEDTIVNVINTGYNFLFRLQESYAGVYRFTMSGEEVRTRELYDSIIYVKKDFVESQNRKRYKTSKFYGKYITMEDINKHRDIFSYMPIVLINGKLLGTFKIRCLLDGSTEISFNPKIVQEKIENVQVIFVRNCINNSVSITKAGLSNRNYLIPSSYLPKTTNDHVVQFFSLIGDEFRKTSMLPIQFNEEGNIYIDSTNSEISTVLKYSSNLRIELYSLTNCYPLSYNRLPKKRIDKEVNSFVTVISPDNKKSYETLTMPVPVENLLVTKRNTQTNAISIVDNANVLLHYPNIYEIEINEVVPENTVYDVNYFYYAPSQNLEFKNRFYQTYKYFYQKYQPMNMEDIVESFIYKENEDHAMSEYFMNIFNYKEPEYSYSIDDYLNSEFDNPLDYKISKMREFMIHNSHLMRDYMNSLNEGNFNTYYLDVSKIDLSSRIRVSTEQEAIKGSAITYFPYEHYVFIFRNDDFNPADFRIFIDGILCTDYRMIENGFYQYIYIPVSKINKESHIEIEKFFMYTKSVSIRFTSINNPIDIKFDDAMLIHPTLNDVFITDMNGNHIDINAFDFYNVVDNVPVDITPRLNQYVNYLDHDNGSSTCIKLPDGRYIDTAVSKTPVKCVKLNTLRIIAHDINILHKDLKFCINKQSFMTTSIMTDNIIPKIMLTGNGSPCKNDSDFIRVFINGKYSMIPYDIYEDDGGLGYLIPNVYLEKGDSFTVDITPYTYQEEFKLNEIPENWIVDFEDKLQNPFDLRYYDAYLNGRKLSKFNIQILSNNKIAILNASSRKNFVVYSKDSDLNFFGVIKPEYDEVDAFLNSQSISEKDKMDIIDMIISDGHVDEKIVPNTDIEPAVDQYEPIPTETRDDYRFFLDVIMSNTVFRPNTMVMNEEIIKKAYPHTYATYISGNGRMVIRPNLNRDAKDVVMIGKNYNDSSEEFMRILNNYMGNPELLDMAGDNDMSEVLNHMVSGFNGIRFTANSDVHALEVVQD